MNDLKKHLAKVPAILIQSRIIIVTIIVLIMMGFGLVQINSAITSEPSSANSDAQLQNQVLGKRLNSMIRNSQKYLDYLVKNQTLKRSEHLKRAIHSKVIKLALDGF